MRHARHLTGRLRRTRGWRLRILWMLLGILLVAAAVAAYQTRPHRLARHGATLLEAATGAQARVRTATLSPTGQIRLEGVRLHLPGDKSEGGRLFEADEVAIDADLLAILAGRLRVRSVTFVGPTLYVTEHLDSGQFNFQLLPHAGDEREDLPTHLPGLILRGAAVQFGAIDESGYHPAGQLELAGVLAETAPAAYRFELHHRGAARRAGPTLSGRFDLREHSFAIALTDFSFAAPESHFLPRRIRTIWEQFSPSGKLPSVRFSSSPEEGRRLTVQLRDGAMSVPLGERPPRVTQVSGDFDITDQRMTIQRLTGAIAGVEVTATGHFDAQDPRHGPMSLQVLTEPFDLPEEPDLLADLPPAVQQHYGRFRPSGRFKVAATASRDAAGEPLRLDGALDLLGVQAAYHGFPYPLRDVTGRISFNRERVHVENLAGLGPTGATFAVSGTISPPTEGSEVKLLIDARGVAIDDHLRSAMEPGHRKALDLFFDADAYQQLLSQDLVRLPGVAGEAPAFALGGLMDVRVEVYRPLGHDQDYRVTNTITAHGVNTLFKHWAYPWTVQSGQLVLGPDAFELRQVQAVGPTGGRATLSGIIDRPTRETIAPRLTVSQIEIPVDELLLSSVPAPQDQWARLAHLRGSVRGEGEIFADGQGKVDWRIAADLAGGTAEPFAGGYLVTDLQGSAVLTRDGIDLRGIAGRRDGATVGVDGQVAWPTKPTQFDLVFSGEQLSIDPDLLGLVPPELDARQTLDRLLKTYQARGVTDATLELRGAANGSPLDFRLRLMPRELAVVYNGGNVQLREMSGAAEIGPELIALESISGRFETGSFTVGGSILQGEQGRASLNFTAEADRIDPTTRAVLPETVRAVLDELDYAGGYRIAQGRLVTRPGAQTGKAWDFTADIEVNDAGATLGAPVTGLHGMLGVTAHQQVGDTWPHIELALNAPQLRIADRQVHDLQLSLSNAAMADVLMLQQCTGRMYGGELLSSGFVELGDAGRYTFEIQLVGVDVDSFRTPDHAIPQPQTDQGDDFVPPQTPSGTIAANLLIEQRRGKPDTRRGRGSVAVRDARLYDQPLPTALIEAINLRLPTTSSFDRASARFDIAGDQVLFESIRIESPSIAVVGAGTMDWNTHELDLAMFTRNTGGLRLGGLSDIFNLLKDELIGVQVRGTLADPDARVAALSGLRETLSDAEKRPAPPPITPSR